MAAANDVQAQNNPVTVTIATINIGGRKGNDGKIMGHKERGESFQAILDTIKGPCIVFVQELINKTNNWGNNVHISDHMCLGYSNTDLQVGLLWSDTFRLDSISIKTNTITDTLDSLRNEKNEPNKICTYDNIQPRSNIALFNIAEPYNGGPIKRLLAISYHGPHTGRKIEGRNTDLMGLQKFALRIVKNLNGKEDTLIIIGGDFNIRHDSMKIDEVNFNHPPIGDDNEHILDSFVFGKHESTPQFLHLVRENRNDAFDHNLVKCDFQLFPISSTSTPSTTNHTTTTTSTTTPNTSTPSISNRSITTQSILTLSNTTQSTSTLSTSTLSTKPQSILTSSTVTPSTSTQSIIIDNTPIISTTTQSTSTPNTLTLITTNQSTLTPSIATPRTKTPSNLTPSTTTERTPAPSTTTPSTSTPNTTTKSTETLSTTTQSTLTPSTANLTTTTQSITSESTSSDFADFQGTLSVGGAGAVGEIAADFTKK